MPSFWIEIEHNGAMQNFPFEGKSDVCFGRDQMADFVLDHPTVSRQHARIQHNPQSGYSLLVMSQGGLTAVDGQRVSGHVPIYDGSVLNFGQIRMIFRSHEAQPKPGGGFGAPPGQPSGFGAPPGQTGGFGAPPGQPSGFGAPPGQAGGGFGAPPGQPSGGFGAAAQQPAPPQQPAQPIGGGFSGFNAAPPNPEDDSSIGGEAASLWDQIAAEGEAELEEDGLGDAPQVSDFERMNQAQAKADEGGTNPALIIVTLLALGGVGYLFLAPPEGPQKIKNVGTPAGPLKCDDMTVQVKCIGKEDCLEQALAEFKIGQQLYEKQDTRVSNLFESFRKMRQAEELLKQGNLEIPPEMKALGDQKQRSCDELNTKFKKYGVDYKFREGRDMHDNMAEILISLQNIFPDKASGPYKWAELRETEMRSKGIYPVLKKKR